MKYSLTLHDLSAAQVTQLVNNFADTEIKTAGNDNVTIAPIAAQNNQVAATTVADIASLLTDTTDQLLGSGKTGEVDSTGSVWDERIHSGSKKKNADGKWKLRKGVDESLVASVKNELTGPGFLQNEPVTIGHVAGVPVIAPATYVAPVAAPVATPAPVMAAPIAPARDFSGLMLKISSLFASKLITPDYPNTIVQRVNQGFGATIATLTDIQHDPRMVEYSWQCLEVDGKAA